MTLSSRVLAFSCVLGSSSVLFSQNLLVLSKQDQTLAIVDPATLQIVAKVPVGNDPHEVIASSDGHTAYISNYGFGAFHTLAVIDLVARKPLPVVDLGALRGPHGVAFEDGKLWFTAEAAKVFGRYDPATQKIDLILGTGQDRTHMIWVSADSHTIVTTNVTSGTVSIFEQHDLPMPGPPPGTSPSAGASSPPASKAHDPVPRRWVAPVLRQKTGIRRSFPSAMVPKASMSRRTANRSGRQTHRTALSR